MKKCYLMAALAVMMLASCSHDFDLFESYSQEKTDEAEISSHLKSIFGVTFDPNQDWNMTQTGEVTIVANSSVKKVQLLANVNEADEGAESWVTPNAMYVLNEKELNGETYVKLNYDAPKDILGLYVAFVSDQGLTLRKVKDNRASIDETNTKSRITRGMESYPYPTNTFTIQSKELSYASSRTYNVNGSNQNYLLVDEEYLYSLSDADYANLKMTLEDYSGEYKDLFGMYVFQNFPNGKGFDNLPKVKASGIYNSKVYPITTGKEPIVVTPVYKCDNPTKYGYEVYNSDLYYYYFKADVVIGATKQDTIAYFQSLPKYKAFPFNICFDAKSDNVIGKQGSFVLLYYGDGTPEVGTTTGKLNFPEGYKIGFMVRAKTEAEKGVKKGELYGDGRLNNAINTDKNYNFKGSELGEDGPRAAWLELNGRLLMCWESGTDKDFNDIILDIEGGITGIIPPPIFTYNTYTFCFEDTEKGDYDLNDLVILAERLSETSVRYSIQACGAHDELYVKNINCGVINDNAEIHSLFGLAPRQFVNTEKGAKKYPAVSVVKEVPSTFTFSKEENLPYLYDGTTQKTIRMAHKGTGPHAILIPNKFKYPYERTGVHKAYKRFNEWGTAFVVSTDWYMHPVNGMVYEW